MLTELLISWEKKDAYCNALPLKLFSSCSSNRRWWWVWSTQQWLHKWFLQLDQCSWMLQEGWRGMNILIHFCQDHLKISSLQTINEEVLKWSFAHVTWLRGWRYRLLSGSCYLRCRCSFLKYLSRYRTETGSLPLKDRETNTHHYCHYFIAVVYYVIYFFIKHYRGFFSQKSALDE